MDSALVGIGLNKPSRWKHSRNKSTHDEMIVQSKSAFWEMFRLGDLPNKRWDKGYHEPKTCVDHQS
jgi:hypothetical protein